MKKAIIVILPIMFTAQACNFLFGDIYGEQASGTRGVMVSVDSGGTWADANKINPNKSLSGAQVMRLHIEEGTSENILAATLNAGLYGSDDKAETWTQLLPGYSAYDVHINPINHDEIYTSGSKGGLPAVMKSADRGGTWTRIYSAPTKGIAVEVIKFDPKNSAVIYAGLSSGTMLRSIDGGQTWKGVADLPDRIWRIALGNDAGGTIYALLREQGFRKSQDGGKTWVEVKLPDDAKRFNDLYNDDSSPSLVMVATDKGLYRSSDSGNNWAKIGLPLNPEGSNVAALTVNPDKKSQIFAAIKYTIYRSDDAGQTWKTVSLPTGRTVGAIVVDPEEPNRVYAGLR